MAPSGDKVLKKKRIRTRQLSKNICKQIEFYFSDSNLQKSEFMSQLINNSKDGCMY